MKYLITLSLLFLVSCSKNNNSSKTSPTNPVDLETPVLAPAELTASSEDSLTKNSTTRISIQTNILVDKIKIYSNSSCNNIIQEISPNSLQTNVILNLNPDQVNEFYFSITNENNQVLLNCQKKIEIVQDQTAPLAPSAEYFLNQSGNTNQTVMATGGDSSDFNEDIQFIKYYLYNSINDSAPVFIMQASKEDFLAKTVMLPISQGIVNYFKLSLVDLAGNESNPQGGFTILNQTNVAVPKAILEYTLQAKNNKATNEGSILIQGFAHLQSTGIDIYQNNTLINTISVAEFNAGISVPLIENSTNTFTLVNKQNATFSENLLFQITHDNIKPNPPVFDPEVFLDASEDYELSEPTLELYGTSDENLSTVLVYTDSSLSEVDRILDVFENLFFGEVSFYTFGLNTFYVVGVDEAGNKSDPINVTFNHVNYDLPE